MSFYVPCECSESLCVSEGAAGASLRCSCGKTVVVPSLDELRKRSGLPARQTNPKTVIEYMLADGELPTATTCAGCGCATGEILYVTAECEKAWRSGPNWSGMIVALLIVGPIWAYLLSRKQGSGTEYGDNLILHLPIRTCSNCRRQYLGGPISKSLGWIAALLAGIGIVAVFVWPIWGGVFLVGSLAAFWTKMVVGVRRRATCAWLLRHEPVYGDLLAYYPNTALLPSDAAGNS